jgi:hypothetical protein
MLRQPARFDSHYREHGAHEEDKEYFLLCTLEVPAALRFVIFWLLGALRVLSGKNLLRVKHN